MRTALIIIIITLYSCGFGNNENESKDDSMQSSESTQTETTKKVETQTWRNWKAPSNLEDYGLDALVLDPFQATQLYSALAVYKEGETVLRVQIVDASTEKGKSEVRDHFKIANQNINTESEFGYEKTIEHNGQKVKEEHIKASGDYMMKFLLKDRYGVSVKSNAESAEVIWKLIDQLQLDNLE